MFAFFTAACPPPPWTFPMTSSRWAASPRGARAGRVLAAVRVRAIRRTRPAARGADDRPLPVRFGEGGFAARRIRTRRTFAHSSGSRRKILTFLGGGLHYSVSYPMVFQHSAGCPIARIHVYRRRLIRRDVRVTTRDRVGAWEGGKSVIT